MSALSYLPLIAGTGKTGGFNSKHVYGTQQTDGERFYCFSGSEVCWYKIFPVIFLKPADF